MTPQNKDALISKVFRSRKSLIGQVPEPTALATLLPHLLQKLSELRVGREVQPEAIG